ncbi:MAG TPA: DUF3788 family protein, partial [bacterium]|nr:DUF3788 family protein [bacterium]
MEKPILSDPEQYPTDEIIFGHIGKSKPLWLALFDHIRSAWPDIAPEWRYYNDGKSWLLKATAKKKTIFWLSIVEGGFRTTFYLNAKAETAVMASAIADELKEQYRQSLQTSKFPALTILYRDEQDLENAKALIALKVSLK